MSFVFYDVETTGLKKAFDQILQFAAIRTDASLKETDRFEVRCRAMPHMAVSPKAMLVNGIGAEKLDDPALPSHYGMMQVIERRLREWSPAVFVGHNSIRFDEEFLRRGLWKTLHYPYVTNSNGSGRLDSLHALQAVALFDPGALVVPLDRWGRQSFRLGSLAEANGGASEGLHNAMVDAEALLFLCRRVAERVPVLWQRIVGLSSKAAVQELVWREDVLCFVEGAQGGPCCRFVSFLRENPRNSRELLMFDLSNDPEGLRGSGDMAFAARTVEGPHGAVCGVRSNGAPMICAYREVPERFRFAVPDQGTLARRVASVKGDSVLGDRLVEAWLAGREEWKSSPYVDEQIYNGFTKPEDSRLLELFHRTAWENRRALLAQLSDQRLCRLGGRLIHFEAPDSVSEHERQDFRKKIANCLMMEPKSVPWRTLPEAVAEADLLLAKEAGNERKVALLRGHRDRLVRQLSGATQTLGRDGF